MASTPLDAATLRARLVAPAGPYAAIDVVASTGSTNADLARAAAAGAADRTVLIAEEQTEGRGRHGRSWASPPGTGVYLSVLLRPENVAPDRLGWLPLLAGLAAVRAVMATTGVPCRLKWPNDLLIGNAKAAGTLAEVVGSNPPSVVVGTGVNVSAPPERVTLTAGALPPISLSDAAGAPIERTDVAATLLLALAEIDARWRSAGGDVVRTGLLAEYRAQCATLGRRVDVRLGESSVLTGTAQSVDETGQLQLRLDDGSTRAISAGDVVHLRTVVGRGGDGAAIQ